jgi:glucose-6-phosphate 1-dehydrogenase
MPPGFDVGKPAPGYREEPGVDPQSRIETYVALQIFIDNWRWARRPLLHADRQTIAEACERDLGAPQGGPPILFNADPSARPGSEHPVDPHPADEGFRSASARRFRAARAHLPVKMDFHYGSTFGGSTPEAYERLLLDVMHGDPRCSCAATRSRPRGDG